MTPEERAKHAGYTMWEGQVSVLISIDPGLKGCGVAAFRDGLLYDATYVTGPRAPTVLGQAAATADAVAMWIGLQDPQVLAVEFPQVYRQRTGPDPNDLLALAAVLGGIVPRVPDAALLQFHPHDWKGSVKGEVMIERIQKALRVDEHAFARAGMAEVPRGLQHNSWDAVGIGLHALSRLTRKREYPR